ncbi:MAG: tetratricopeptide repeat protein [Candidatus Riflebacteria bacterium]|nr:tetratricopeptide repeat protein [Candidatus Riflebacteria bacterium]
MKRLILTILLFGASVALGMAEDAQSLKEDANELYARKKYAEALEVYQKVVSTFPDAPEASIAQLMVGINFDLLAAEKKDPALLEKSREAFEKLIQRYPESPELESAYLYLGQAYGGFTAPLKLKDADDAKAVELLTMAVRRIERKRWICAQAKGRIAQILERQGKKEKAVEIYEEIVRSYPDTPWGKELIATIRPSMTVATGSSPGSDFPPASHSARVDDPQDLHESAFSLFRQKKFDQAIPLFQRVIEMLPNSRLAQDSQMMIGIACDGMKRPDRAIQAYEKFLRDGVSLHLRFEVVVQLLHPNIVTSFCHCALYVIT